VQQQPDDPAVEESPSPHYQMLKELGDCYAAVADFQRARECYRQAASLAPDEPGPYVGLGVIGIQTDALEDARAAFEVARKLDPHCAEAYGGLAMVRHQRLDYQGAFDMYLKCLQFDTDNLVALLGLFQTSRQMGTFCKIIHYLEVYLDKHPDDAAVLFCLATLYLEEDRLQEACLALSRVLELQPGKPEAAALLADVQQKMARQDHRQRGTA